MTFSNSVRAPAQKSQSEGHFRESNAPPARLQSSESKPHWQPYLSNWESNNGRPIRGFGGFLRLICELNSEAPLHLINGDTPLHLATYLRQHEYTPPTHNQSLKLSASFRPFAVKIPALPFAPSTYRSAARYPPSLRDLHYFNPIVLNIFFYLFIFYFIFCFEFFEDLKCQHLLGGSYVRVSLSLFLFISQYCWV